MFRLACCVWLLVGVFFFASGFLLSRSELGRTSAGDSSPRQGQSESRTAPVFSRLVLVVADALRWDWTHASHLPRTHLALKHTRFVSAQFRSDPPTTTAQRLKGLTTGSLPTFIDVSKNFGGPAILEDNWLDQMKRAGRKIVVMGDDTWDSLFPGRFERKYLFPSFNVRDLDTVDNGVLAHFQHEFENQSEWDVLIAHFLGLDHAGHTFGRDTPQIESKLNQLDAFLANLVPQIASDTLLVVLGDHGMTASGNHGGASEDEILSGLLIISPGLPMAKKLQEDRPVPQIDLVPTLSLLLGVPIPFASLGCLMKEVFQPSHFEKALDLNVWQVRRYISAYAESYTHVFPVDELRKLAGLTGEAYLRGAAEMCRSVWATFDLFSMTVGLVGEAMVLVLLFCCGEGKVSINGCLLGFMLGPIVMLLVGSHFDAASSQMLFASGAYLGPLMTTVVLQKRVSVHVEWLSFILIGLHALSLLSNSFIEAERNVNSFLLLSGLLVLLVCDGKRWPVYGSLILVSLIAPLSHLGAALLLIAAFLMKRSLTCKILVAGVFVFFFLLDSSSQSSWTVRVLFPRVLFAGSVAFSLLFRDLELLYAPCLLLIMGPKGACAFSAFLLQRGMVKDLPHRAWLMVFLSRACFFNAGHLSQFSTIQFETGFLAWDDAPMVFSGALIVVNTLGPFFLVPSKSAKAFVLSHWVTSGFCFFARRHLMVWRVFAPKFVFETAICILVVLVSLVDSF